MVVQLPEDILHIICDELHQREDIASLFNIAVSSKHVAPLALSTLYRRPNTSGGTEDESVGFDANSLLIVQKWSIAWRSIILSAFDRTMFPYYKFLRTLDLRNFQSLIEDTNFNDRVARAFFAGEMAQFNITREFKFGKGRTRKRLLPIEIVEAVGDTLAPKTPMVEELTGHFSSGACQRWIQNLPRLKRLMLWDGDALADEQTRQTIISTCPSFEALEMYMWLSPDADAHLGSFLSGLPEQSLKQFTTFGDCKIAHLGCQALTQHNKSLRELSIYFGPDAIAAMSLLKDCTLLESLKMEIPTSFDLEGTQNDVFQELISWLSECTRLRRIELMNFNAAPGLLTPLLLNEAHSIEELTVSARGHASAIYLMKDNAAFHLALANSKHLRALDLLGDPEDSSRDDIEILVGSLSKISSLRNLKLRGVSDYFSDDAIISLLASLPKLEEVYLSGLSSTDEVLEVIPSLSNLRQITLAADNSTFTSHGLMNLVTQLGAGNEGLELNIPLADPEELIPDVEVQYIRDVLMQKVGPNGRFEYQGTRDPNVPEFEGESD